MTHIGTLDLTARIRALREQVRPTGSSPDTTPLARLVIGWIEASRSAPTIPPSDAREPVQSPALSDTLRKLLEVREADIARLRQGSDAAILRRFLTRFIKVHQAAVDIVSDGEASVKDVELLRDLLADALEASGVTAFNPSLGADYRTAAGVDDSPKLVPNTDPSRDFRIATIVRAGYQLETAEGPTTLMPAKVRVYQPVDG